MDIFNKEKFNDLDQRVNYLSRRIDKLYGEIEKEIERLSESKSPICYSVGDSVPEQSILSLIGQQFSALLDYLKVESFLKYEKDPNYYEPLPKRIRVWKIRKMRKIRKSSKK